MELQNSYYDDAKTVQFISLYNYSQEKKMEKQNLGNSRLLGVQNLFFKQTAHWLQNCTWCATVPCEMR
jgi:hypothetical protein